MGQSSSRAFDGARNDQEERPSLQADWSARGVFGRVTGWHFLIIASLISADAPSYSSSNILWAALGNKAALQKRRKYQLIAEELRGSLTPLICSTDCVLHTEYAAYQRRLAQRLAAKRGKPYSVVLLIYSDAVGTRVHPVCYYLGGRPSAER